MGYLPLHCWDLLVIHAYKNTVWYFIYLAFKAEIYICLLFWVPFLMGNRWGDSGNSVRLYFLGGSKITADGEFSYEIKRCLLLGRKVMPNLDSILKSKDITLPTKVCLVKAMVFPVVIYGCECWTIKKAEWLWVDAFWTVVLEKTLESPLDCKEIQPVNPKGKQS